jgi:hypothetical protein
MSATNTPKNANRNAVINTSKKNNNSWLNSFTSMFSAKNNSQNAPANGQTGGVAPVNYRYPPNMQQPSEAVMEWATTADAPTPLSGMRNVAHGGRRKHRTRKHKRSHTRKHRVHRRKNSHRRRR